MKQNSIKIVQGRLLRIEGQVRGLMQMIDNDRDSKEVLTLLSAVRAALDSVGSIVISDHIEEISGSAELSPEVRNALKAMLKTFLR